MVATPVEPLDQVPPAVASDNWVVEPIQTDAVPVMAAGAGGKAFTVTVCVAVLLQPLALVTV